MKQNQTIESENLNKNGQNKKNIDNNKDLTTFKNVI